MSQIKNIFIYREVEGRPPILVYSPGAGLRTTSYFHVSDGQTQDMQQIEVGEEYRITEGPYDANDNSGVVLPCKRIGIQPTEPPQAEFDFTND